MTVVLKLASSPNAAANSFKVSKVDGAESAKLAIAVETKAVPAMRYHYLRPRPSQL